MIPDRAAGSRRIAGPRPEGRAATRRAVVPADIARILADGDPAPAGFSREEQGAFDRLRVFYSGNPAYVAMMNTRPQTIGYSLDDLPACMAACAPGSVA